MATCRPAVISTAPLQGGIWARRWGWGGGGETPSRHMWASRWGTQCVLDFVSRLSEVGGRGADVSTRVEHARARSEPARLEAPCSRRKDFPATSLHHFSVKPASLPSQMVNHTYPFLAGSGMMPLAID